MTITGYKKLGSSSSTWDPVDEDEIKEFLYETGPLAVALNANPLQTYTGGILDKTSSQCPISGMNHAVTMVGYGSESGKDYWIIKNSWGKAAAVSTATLLLVLLLSKYNNYILISRNLIFYDIK